MNDGSDPPGHFGFEGWVGAIPGTDLAANPSLPLTGRRTTEDAQRGGCDG